MALFKKDARKIAKQRLEKARIKTLQGYDQSDDNILISIPEQKTNAETARDVFSDIIHWVLMVVIFAFFFIGVVAMIVPDTRNILIGIVTDAFNNVFGLVSTK